jgi:hypothetical protein
VAATFFDENDPALGKALADQYGNVVYPGHPELPEPPRQALEDEWLRVVGMKVITRDQRIRYRPVEKHRWVQHRVRGFVLTGTTSQSTGDSLVLLECHWEGIAIIVEVMPEAHGCSPRASRSARHPARLTPVCRRRAMKRLPQPTPGAKGRACHRTLQGAEVGPSQGLPSSAPVKLRDAIYRHQTYNHPGWPAERYGAARALDFAGYRAGRAAPPTLRLSCVTTTTCANIQSASRQRYRPIRICYLQDG